MIGKEVFSTNVGNTPKSSAVVEMGDLPKGNYWLRVSAAQGEILTGRFIKD